VTDALRVLLEVVAIFERLRIPYCLGGSLASSAHGVPRATLDADVVADLRPEHAAALVEALAATFYVDRARVDQAIATRGSFNAIHLETLFKLDVFAVRDDPGARRGFERRQRLQLVAEPATAIMVASPEDLVIEKLRWFRLGGEVSDRQWGDVTGILRVQGARLDRGYLESAARDAGVEDLLSRAWEQD
jgi:hypothetical protein